MGPKRDLEATADSSKNKAKKSRSPNWSVEENERLVDAMSEHYNQLYGQLSATLTDERKNKIWEQVHEEVNSISVNNRELKAIKDHWTDLKSKVKSKASKLLKARLETGGGEMDEIDITGIEERLQGLILGWELIVVRLIEKTGLLGIDGGYDSSKPEIMLVDVNEEFSGPSGAESRNEEAVDVIFDPVTVAATSTVSSSASLSKGKIGGASIKGKLPQPERRADVIGQSMLSIQEEILKNTGRIADVLEEFLVLKKIEKGLSPNMKLTKDVKIVNVPNE